MMIKHTSVCQRSLMYYIYYVELSVDWVIQQRNVTLYWCSYCIKKTELGNKLNLYLIMWKGFSCFVHSLLIFKTSKWRWYVIDICMDNRIPRSYNFLHNTINSWCQITHLSPRLYISIYSDHVSFSGWIAVNLSVIQF